MSTSLFFLVWGLGTALALPLLLPFRARSVAGIHAFILANVLAIVSLLAYSTDSFLPADVYIFASALAWIGAVSAVYVGIRQFFGLVPYIGRTVLAATCVIALFIVAEFVLHSQLLRLTLFSFYTCIGLGSAGWVILRKRDRIQTQGVVLYAATAILGLAVLHAFRLAIYLSGVEPVVSVLQPSPWGLFFMVCGAVTVPAVFLALLLLIQTGLAEQMQAALTFDNLTKAYSRRSILAELDYELQRCARSGNALGVLVLDIDHFKAVNDKYGHAAGDTALRHFANVVQSTVRASDRFGRLGGEEFVLITYDCTPARAWRQALRVRDAVSATPLHIQGAFVSMTVSGGLAAFQPGDTADEILARADAALYRAKESGRNQIQMALGNTGPTPIYAGIDLSEHRATVPRELPETGVQSGQHTTTA